MKTRKGKLIQKVIFMALGTVFITAVAIAVISALSSRNMIQRLSEEELRVANYDHFDIFYNETKKNVFFSIAALSQRSHK